MIIYLVRHGQDDETVRGGWSRQPLSLEGILQAKAVAEHIQTNIGKLNIKEIYSSDLPRAMQTAKEIADSISLPIISAPQFREVNNGDLAGMKNTLALKKYPGLFWNQLEWDQCYPNGESPQLFYERIAAAWNALVQEKHDNILLVTHGGVIQVILSIIRGETYTNKMKHRTISYTEMIALAYDGKTWQELGV